MKRKFCLTYMALICISLLIMKFWCLDTWAAELTEEDENEKIIEEILLDTEEKIEDELEGEIDKKIITIIFNDTYGYGEYKISGENNEWEQATGTVEVDLFENSNITIQVKANDGYFIVSEQPEAFLMEKEIILSWDDESALSEYYVDFESKVTGTVELDNAEGFWGNEFTGIVKIDEGINNENLSCEWVYETDAVEMITAGTEVGEPYKFKVMDSTSRTTEITAKVYRNGIFLGTTTKATYNILPVDTDKVVNSFGILGDKEDQVVIDLLEQGETNIVGETKFLIQLNEEYIQGINHEVSKVIVTYASKEQVLEVNDEGTYVGSINVNEEAAEIVVPEVKVILNGNNQITLSAKHCLHADKSRPYVTVHVIDDNKTFASGWISEQMVSGDLQLKISVTDNSKIEKCKVTSSDGEKVYEIDKNEQGNYYVNIETKSNDYVINVEDEGGNCTEIQYKVQVDNEKPKERVKVSIASDKRIILEETMSDVYFIGEQEAKVYCDGHITMELEVEDGQELSEDCSGINKVIVTAKVTSLEGCKDVQYKFEGSETEKGKNKRTLYLCVNEEQLEPEMNYQIKDIYIEDFAGNGITLSESVEVGEMSCVDKVMYFIDGKQPAIEYEYADTLIDTEEENVIYYSEFVEGTIAISDLNLEKYEIEVENVDNYEIAEIEEEIDDNNTISKYRYKLNSDGEYQIRTKVNPISGYEVEKGEYAKESQRMIVDTVAPVINVKLLDEKGSELTDYTNKYYNYNIKAHISIEEKNIETITTQIFNDRNGETLYTQDNFLESEDKSSYEFEAEIREEGQYYLQIVCQDKTGKETIYKSEIFNIDKTLPVVSITYDNNSAVNEIYYNEERTATIRVEDITLDKDKISLDIHCKEENVPTLSEWSETENETGKCFIAYATFSEDDVYDVSFSCSDLAGNTSEECDGGHFVIDCTSPVVRIGFDNNSNQNEHYYKEDRIASIVIEDVSFDKDSFSVVNKEIEDGVSVTSSGVWTDSETLHVTKIECAQEGAYQFSVQAKDMAGNEAVVVNSEYFVIDKTAPMIEIAGVENESANQGDVAPQIKYTDIHLDDNISTVYLSGYKNKDEVVEKTITVEGKSRIIQYTSFPKEKQIDDVYTLMVHIEDKAGNIAEEEYIFSVNRFGSTFGLDKETMELVEKYYTNAEQDIVIMETNVDVLQLQEISISVNGMPQILQNGKDYAIETQGNSATWKAYKYIIFKENFKEEGQYAVTVFSRDAANNQSDNNVQELEVSFAVDKSAPSIVVTGLEDNTTYDQAELFFNMDIQDNMYLQTASVMINGVEVQSYNQDDLKSAVSHKILASDETQEIVIMACDIVGNTSEKRFSNVLITPNVGTVEAKDTTISDGLVPVQDKVALADNRLKDINALYIWTVALGMVVFGSVILAIVLQKRKEVEEV